MATIYPTPTPHWHPIVLNQPPAIIIPTPTPHWHPIVSNHIPPTPHWHPIVFSQPRLTIIPTPHPTLTPDSHQPLTLGSYHPYPHPTLIPDSLQPLTLGAIIPSKHWHSIAISHNKATVYIYTIYTLSQTMYWHADWPRCISYLLKADWLVAYSSKSSYIENAIIYMQINQMNISWNTKLSETEMQ